MGHVAHLGPISGQHWLILHHLTASQADLGAYCSLLRAILGPSCCVFLDYVGDILGLNAAMDRLSEDPGQPDLHPGGQNYICMYVCVCPLPFDFFVRCSKGLHNKVDLFGADFFWALLGFSLSLSV